MLHRLLRHSGRMLLGPLFHLDLVLTLLRRKTLGHLPLAPCSAPCHLPTVTALSGLGISQEILDVAIAIPPQLGEPADLPLQALDLMESGGAWFVACGCAGASSYHLELCQRHGATRGPSGNVSVRF